MSTNVYEQPYQKEKDYIEELFLSEIYNSVGEVLAFKGGTALAKFYGSVRFSDDLDFSALGNETSKAHLALQLGGIIGRIMKSYPVRALRKFDTVDMIVYELSIRGPLYEMLNKYQHLKIEISKIESAIEETNAFRHNPIYEDLRPYVATVMNGKEMLAEKIDALLFRRNIKARDLYDIYFLLNKGVHAKVSLIDRKMKERKHVFSEERMLRRLEAIARIWGAELIRLVPEKNFVEFGVAKEKLIDELKSCDML